MPNAVYGQNGTCAFADVKESADVRMIQGGNSARLAFESFPAAAIDGGFPGQHLDSNDPIAAPVACFIHLTHAPGSNQPEHLVGPQVNAGHETHA